MIDFDIARVAFLVILFATLVLLVGMILLLQYYLSNKENKWLGLILPITSFCISLVALLGVLGLTAFTLTSVMMVDGEIVEQTVTQVGDMSAIIATALFVFLIYNIPTVVLLALYGGCRSKRNRQRALGKMSVQDLE